MSNTRFNYIYRDGSNCKRHGEIILSGPFDPDDLEKLQASLDEGSYFIAKQVNLPEKFHFKLDCCTEGEGDQYFPYSQGVDHAWHEFAGLDSTLDEPTDTRTFARLLEDFQRASMAGWDESLSELPTK